MRYVLRWLCGTFVAFGYLSVVPFFYFKSPLLTPVHWCCWAWLIPDRVLERTFIPFIGQCLCRDIWLDTCLHPTCYRKGWTRISSPGLWPLRWYPTRFCQPSCNAKLGYAVVFCSCIGAFSWPCDRILSFNPPRLKFIICVLKPWCFCWCPF